MHGIGAPRRTGGEGWYAGGMGVQIIYCET